MVRNKQAANTVEGPGFAGRGRELVALAALVALHFAFFWRAALLRGFLVHSDICYQFEPFKVLLHESLRAGRLPLWSPYIFCGYPIAAEGQIAAFYPPGLLISWLLPSPAAINWLIVSHLMLAAVGMYLFARATGLKHLGAMLAAIVFSFSGYLFAHIHHISLICTAAWLPLILLLVERARRGPLLVYGTAAAMAWAAAALCGHPQTLFHISLTVVFWMAWRAIQQRRNGAITVLRRGAALAALVFLLGLGLASVQLLLTADLSRLAPHGERGALEYVTSFSLLPKHLIGLVAPNWQGTPADNSYRGEDYYWEYVLYLGLAPLALAIVGATSRRGRVWAGLAVASLLLSLAAGNPLYHLLRFLPGFADFRVPARFIFIFTFAAAMLAGLGYESVLSRRRLKAFHASVMAAAVIAALSVVDLGHFGRSVAPLAGPEVFRARPRIVQFLKEEPSWGRSLVVPPIPFYANWSPPGGWADNPDGWLEARVYLPADVPQSFDLRIVGGYAGFVDPRHAQFFEAAVARASQNHDYSLYSLVGTRHFVMPPSLPLSGLPGAEVPPFRVYLNRDAFPRAFAVGKVAPWADGQDSLGPTLALAEAKALRTTAVVAGDLTISTGARCEISGVAETRPERVLVRAHSDGESLVVLNERWDRGWRARVDGRSARLYETDCVLMAAPIGAGEHTVEFLYQPRGLIIGRAVSLASLVVALAMLAMSARRRRSPRRRRG